MSTLESATTGAVGAGTTTDTGIQERTELARRPVAPPGPRTRTGAASPVRGGGRPRFRRCSAGC